MLKNFYHCTVNRLAKQIVEGDGIVPILNGKMGITAWYADLEHTPDAILHVMKKYKVGIDGVSVLAVYEDEKLFIKFVEGIYYTQCRLDPVFCGGARDFMMDCFPLYELYRYNGRMAWHKRDRKTIDAARSAARAEVIQYAISVVTDDQDIETFWFHGDRPESALSELRSKRGQQDLIARSEYLRAKYGEKDSKRTSVKLLQASAR